MKAVSLLRLIEGVSGRVGVGIQDIWLACCLLLLRH